jgi:hypothetical protein
MGRLPARVLSRGKEKAVSQGADNALLGTRRSKALGTASMHVTSRDIAPVAKRVSTTP